MGTGRGYCRCTKGEQIGTAVLAALGLDSTGQMVKVFLQHQPPNLVSIEGPAPQGHPIKGFVNDIVALLIIDMNMYAGFLGSFRSPHNSLMRAPDSQISPGVDVPGKVNFPIRVYPRPAAVEK
ncbi:MAG: hypothetical protein ACRDTG_17715 [Pseudonocardiaceae bacterium]